MAKGIFITGTGTDVGKTYITALLVKRLQETGVMAAYYKAAVSGNQRQGQRLLPGDAMYVKKISGISQPLDTMVPYIYEQAVSPHLAARSEGNPVELSVVRQGYLTLCQHYQYITMEGSGGILCPLCWEEKRQLWLEDVIQELKLSCLVVAEAGLGTINATLLTVEYLKARQIAVKGIILNHFHNEDPMEQDNCRVIEKKGGIPVIACVAKGDLNIDISAEKLMSFYS
ncbi:MAG: dethiobiotin synthase [Lachnospiraceae bacterium]|nr:dethiobiotin synthase [Lachnospiraceae bacterium]